ncbi:hypothetical protein FACS1894103_1570 [Campylobacterota bacterium]|nr:hypothetical protein FACS1894103_1570 [Campylobacterota bacterium]
MREMDYTTRGTTHERDSPMKPQTPHILMCGENAVRSTAAFRVHRAGNSTIAGFSVISGYDPQSKLQIAISLKKGISAFVYR